MLSSVTVPSPSDAVSVTDTPFNLVEALETFSIDWFSTKQLIIIIAVVFLLLMIVLEFLRSRYALNVTRTMITLDSLPKTFDGTKLAVISDLHQARFGEYNSELAKRIKRESPDYIFFVGDMGDSKKFNVDAFYDLLESLGDSIPVIAVPGNHDLRLGGGSLHKNFVRETERFGAVILHNTSAEIVSGGNKLHIYGFCQPLAHDAELPSRCWKFADVADSDVEAMLGKCPTDAPVILLAHDPSHIDKYSAWGADLVLSGHHHGGGIRLPFIGGLFGPDGNFLPKYTAGLYRENDTQMFVTRGLGSTVPRFFNPPEIAIVTLTCPDSELLQQPAEPLIVLPHFMPESSDNSAPYLSPANALTSDGDDNSVEKDEGVSKKAAATGRNSSTGTEKTLFSQLKGSITSFKEWFKSENRSLKELLNERLNQLSDFFALMFGKKRSKYSRIADERKQRTTYVAPSSRKKKHKTRYRK